ncbi:MAG: glutamine--tRNA ligase/YqeY domain fusion protein [Archangiaceae bacterium]|nr:glutamine--tRNA ligase/YqeY domain fusion protein [Archangiaceae bacterium]
MGLNFIEEIVEEDNRTGKWSGRVQTRFPPEPNGYLHIGHAKSICLNAGLAKKYNGTFNVRFDDTNPAKEEQEYVDSILRDVRWLAGDVPEGRVFYASDYFDQMFEWAEALMKAGKAYVCDLTADQMREYRGTMKDPGKPSPGRDRSVDENLTLLRKMKAGEFPEGKYTVRAKIDMASGNFNLRDPVMYRIVKAEHHRTGNKWSIYPSYDWAHGLEDSLEKITHSICTLEFENHRPLYDWFLNELGIYHPQQIEFARLNLTYTVMSKRKLLELVSKKHVAGWDDPRMPTISALRRRGYPASAVRTFCEEIGVTRVDSVIDVTRLENAVRNELNRTAERRMAVLKPLKVVIENWPEGHVEQLEAVNNPEDPNAGKRTVPFGKVIYVERDDFMENPPKKFFRLSPGREVRLRWAYFVTCKEVKKDAAGNVTEVVCTYDPATRGGDAPDGRKVKATMHWVAAATAVEAEVRLVDRLFTVESPDGDDYLKNLNPKSLEVVTDAKLEPALANAPVGTVVQFERLGYFNVDADSKPGKLVFNRTVTLKDTWVKEQAKGE